MRLRWLAREYERTCTECGGTWRVPRAAARRRVRSIIPLTGGGRDSYQGEVSRQVAAIETGNRPADALRHCPECGSTAFRQRPRRTAP